MQFIDNGRSFGGSAWTLWDFPIIGTYLHKVVCGPKVTYKLFKSWVDRVMAIDQKAIRAAVAAVPTSWLHGDERQFSDLIDRLLARRNRLSQLTIESVNWLRRDGQHISRVRRRVGVEATDTTDRAAALI